MRGLNIKKGTIKAVIRDKGYGFITCEDGSEIFFHMSGLANIYFEDLQIGQSVEYVEEEGHKGTKAVEITVVE